MAIHHNHHHHNKDTSLLNYYLLFTHQFETATHHDVAKTIALFNGLTAFLGTKKHPIMLGPLLLHYKSDYQTFRTFTDLLESKLNSKIEMLEFSGEAILGKLIIQLRRSALHICSKN
jgi:hypothetical protein